MRFRGSLTDCRACVLAKTAVHSPGGSPSRASYLRRALRRGPCQETAARVFNTLGIVPGSDAGLPEGVRPAQWGFPPLIPDRLTWCTPKGRLQAPGHSAKCPPSRYTSPGEG